MFLDAIIENFSADLLLLDRYFTGHRGVDVAVIGVRARFIEGEDKGVALFGQVRIESPVGARGFVFLDPRERPALSGRHS